MTILNDLEGFTPPRKGLFDDPITHRRDVFITNLNKQILMVDNEKMRGRRWFKKRGKGYNFWFRYASNLVELEKGRTHYKVESDKKLKEVYKEIINEVDKGEFDERLEEHWNKSNFNKEDKIN